MKITIKQARKIFANRTTTMQRKGGDLVKVRELNKKGTSFRDWAREEYKNNSFLSPKLLKIVSKK